MCGDCAGAEFVQRVKDNAGNIGTQGPKTSGSGSDTVRLGNVFRELWSGLPTIVLAAVIGGMIALLGTIFLITPTYTSTSMIYVMGSENIISSLADLQIGTQLTQDYKVLVTSRSVMEKVVDYDSRSASFTRVELGEKRQQKKAPEKTGDRTVSL